MKSSQLAKFSECSIVQSVFCTTTEKRKSLICTSVCGCFKSSCTTIGRQRQKKLYDSFRLKLKGIWGIMRPYCTCFLWSSLISCTHDSPLLQSVINHLRASLRSPWSRSSCWGATTDIPTLLLNRVLYTVLEVATSWSCQPTLNTDMSYIDCATGMADQHSDAW